MKQNLEKRVEALKKKAREKARQEMSVIRRTNWRGMVTEARHAINMVNYAYDETIAMLDHAPLRPQGSKKELQGCWEAFGKIQLDLIESLLNRNSSTEMRIAHLQGYKESIESNEKELKEFEELETAIEVTNNFLENVESAAKLIDDITKKPLNFKGLADEFLSGKIAKAMPQVFKARLSPFAVGYKQNYEQYDEFLKELNKKYGKNLRGAIKFLKVFQAGLTISTIVFETLSNQKEWGRQLATSIFAAGSSFAIGSLITASAITTAIGAAGISVPPLAAPIIAAGLVILAGAALVSLFDTMVNSLFGQEGIPPSMRLSMSTQMYTSMSSSMSTAMSTPMVSLPR